MRYAIEFIISTLSSIGFGLVFSIPKNALLVAGLNGGIGWILYRLTLNFSGSIYFATFLSSLLIASIAEIQARRLRYPASIFNIPGIINLCPGESIYNTMSNFINDNSDIAIGYFYRAVVIAGSIAFGVLLASSFSKSLKSYRIRQTKRTNYLGDYK